MTHSLRLSARCRGSLSHTVKIDLAEPERRESSSKSDGLMRAAVLWSTRWSSGRNRKLDESDGISEKSLELMRAAEVWEARWTACGIRAAAGSYRVADGRSRKWEGRTSLHGSRMGSEGTTEQKDGFWIGSFVD